MFITELEKTCRVVHKGTKDFNEKSFMNLFLVPMTETDTWLYSGPVHGSLETCIIWVAIAFPLSHRLKIFDKKRAENIYELDMGKFRRKFLGIFDCMERNHCIMNEVSYL